MESASKRKMIVASILAATATALALLGISMPFSGMNARWKAAIEFARANQSHMDCGRALDLPVAIASTTVDGQLHVECMDSHPIAIFYLGFGRGENFSAILWSRDNRVLGSWQESGTGQKFIYLDNRIMYLVEDRGDGVYYVGRYED